MACFHPLHAWQTDDGAIIFRECGSIRRPLTLPCGQCVGCRLERSRRWAMRIMHEASMHDASSFVTLTYDEANYSPSLNYSDYQLFMRRLRKRFGKLRFFMCGEYGEDLSRPHFHAILFGCFFHDRYLWSEKGNVRLYRSPILEKLWPYGFSTVGDVTFDSAAYVARYIVGKVTGDAAKAHYERVSLSTGELVNLKPEFCRMSLKPGIGKRWIEKYVKDVYGFDRDSVIVNGVRCKPPRYYDEFLKGAMPEVAEWLEYDRYLRASKSVEDSTPERLAVREQVTKARLSQLKRNYHDL